MRTFTSLLSVALVVTLVGCGDSDRQAAQKIRDQVDLAQRHYVRALGLLTAPSSEAAVGPAVPVNEEAVAALNEARKVLNDALAVEASAGGKVPAQRLLAQVQSTTGDYYAQLFQAHRGVVLSQLSQAERRLQAAQVYASLAGFFEQLASLDASAIEQMKQQAQAEQAQLSQQKSQLDARVAELEGQVNQLAEQNSGLLAQTADLRNRSRSARGQESLDLLKQAGQVDRQINENNARINELKASQETLADELKGVNQALASAQMRMEAMSQRLASLNQLSGESRQQQTAQSQKAQELGEKLQLAGQEVQDAFAAALSANEQAQQAYEQAARANQAALMGLDDLRNRASEIRQEKPESSADAILISLGGPSERAALTAQKGDINLAMGDLRRERLEVVQRVQGFRQRLENLPAQLVGELPAGLSQKIAAAGEVDSLKQAAQESYTTAAEAYESAARFASSVPKADGVDMRAVLWVYQGQKARSLMGLFYLTGDVQYLTDARTLVDTILQENPENPFVAPIRQLRGQMPAGV